MNTDRTKIFFFLISNNDFRDWISEPNDERSLFWKKWMEKYPENITANSLFSSMLGGTAGTILSLPFDNANTKM